MLRNDRPKLHVRKNILLNVNARCNLTQLQSLIGYLKYAALGDEQNMLSFFPAEIRAEGNLLYGLFKFNLLALLKNYKLAVSYFLFKPPAVMVPQKMTL